MYLINNQRSLTVCLCSIGVGLLFLLAPIKIFANQQVDVCKKGSWKKIGTMDYSQSEITILDHKSEKLCKKVKNKEMNEILARRYLHSYFLL